jgi:hypothetical protein
VCADQKESKGWGRRLDGLIERVGDEVGGERGEKVRQRLTEARSRVEAGLEGDEARRLRGEMLALGDRAMERVDDALRHERTQAVVKRVDAAVTEIGDRLRGESSDSRSTAAGAGPESEPASADSSASQPFEPAASVDEATSEADETIADNDEKVAEAGDSAAKRD